MIIGLAGKTGAGKDTYMIAAKAELLKNRFSAVNDSFALGVKQMAASATGTSVERWSDPDFKRNYYIDMKTYRISHRNDFTDDAAERVSVRQFMQLLGDGVREHINENHWTNRVLSYINPDVTTFITDVRYESEFNAIKRLGGKVFHIERIASLPEWAAIYGIDHLREFKYGIDIMSRDAFRHIVERELANSMNPSLDENLTKVLAIMDHSSETGLDHISEDNFDANLVNVNLDDFRIVARHYTLRVVGGETICDA